MHYKTSGNIGRKYDISEEDYLYKVTQPQVNAVNILTKTKQGVINNYEQDIKWNSFNKIEKITEKDYYGTKTNKMSFVYGISDERTKAVATEIASDNIEQAVCTKYYAGTYEKEVYPDSTRELHYISSDNGLIAIYVKSTDHPAGNMYYILKDHLGSITGIINENGAMLRELSYDAWGRRRDSASWQCFDAHKLQTYKPLISRGYTCHEQMDKFGMINMNGRLYDPVTGQMLSPDNNVSSTFSQGFNRYTYCNNNPLKYIDPTGQIATNPYPWLDWNNYGDYSDDINPFIGGSYIEQSEYLATNGKGGAYYNFRFAGGWIYNENDDTNVGFDGDKSKTDLKDKKEGKNDKNSNETKSENSDYVKIYIETDGFGHAYIVVNGTLFSYGRYEGGYFPSMKSLDPVAPGVLERYEGKGAEEIIKDRTSKNPAEIFEINKKDIIPDLVYNYLNRLYINGKPGEKIHTRIIDTYYFLGHNCSVIAGYALYNGDFKYMLNIESPFTLWLSLKAYLYFTKY